MLHKTLMCGAWQIAGRKLEQSLCIRLWVQILWLPIIKVINFSPWALVSQSVRWGGDSYHAFRVVRIKFILLRYLVQDKYLIKKCSRKATSSLTHWPISKALMINKGGKGEGIKGEDAMDNWMGILGEPQVFSSGGDLEINETRGRGCGCLTRMTGESWSGRAGGWWWWGETQGQV
jgi:hypothetical protein